ncbi:MAG TPA: hypothetical protein PKM67_11435 [Kiritimatiellia bacterium]|nr:hypothetical protein [Kiritimatiellia bacterium]HNS82059.1 hypothetical protein [Kiritimatiellia bacterium]
MARKASAPDFRVLMLFNIDPEWETADIKATVASSRELADGLSQAGFKTVMVPVDKPDLEKVLRPYSPEACIVFNWCESLPGIEHSEGAVVRELERLGFIYTGSTAQALDLSINKPLVKQCLGEWDVPTPRWRVFPNLRNAHQWNLFPAIVKPAHEHCSLGLSPQSVVTTNEELKQQISKLITEMKQPALVEDFVDGREFHVALWGNDELEVLPAAEMDFAGISDMHQRLCDYDAKFTPDSELYNKIGTLLPAPLTAEEKENLESTCRAAYRATGCRDYARIDLRLRDGIFNVLDVNPNPDISSDASMACAADTLGISYGELGRRIVEMALERHPVLPARKPRPANAPVSADAVASPG